MLDALRYKQKDNPLAHSIFLKAMKDKSKAIRIEAINNIEADKTNEKEVLLALQNCINTDIEANVREKAINRIVRIQKAKCVDLLEQVINKDSSYAVIAAALNNLKTYNFTAAYKHAKNLSSTENPTLMMAISKVFKDTIADHLEFFKKAIWLNSPGTAYTNLQSFNEYLEKCDNFTLEKGILFLKDIVKYEESSYNIYSAKQIVRNLKYYFDLKAKKDAQASVKLQIVSKVGREIL